MRSVGVKLQVRVWGIGNKMYCTVENLYEIKSSLDLAKIIRLDIPNYITIEKYIGILHLLTNEDERAVFESVYEEQGTGDYKWNINTAKEKRDTLVNIYMKIDGRNIIEATIVDVSSELDLSLASGGYPTPVSKDKPYHKLINNYCKSLVIYKLMILNGVLDVEGDKQFIKMCEDIYERLKLIAKGEMKLPSNKTDKVIVKSPKKIIEKWSGYNG